MLGYREKERVHGLWIQPPSTTGKYQTGGAGFIAPLSKALPKDHKEQESGWGRVYVWRGRAGWGGDSSWHKGSSW